MPYNLGRDYPASDQRGDDRTRAERRRDADAFQRAYAAAASDFAYRPDVEHLTTLAFLARLIRRRTVICTSADAIYIAGYAAKQVELGRHPGSRVRAHLRRAADHMWSALQLVQGTMGDVWQAR